MAIWATSWLWFASHAVLPVAGVDRALLDWPAGSAIRDVIETLSARGGEAYVAMPSACSVLDAAAPQVVPSVVSVDEAWDILCEWAGIEAWRYEGVRVLFGAPSMPSLLRASARGGAVEGGAGAQPTVRRADLDLEQADLDSVLAGLAAGFGIRFVYDQRPDDAATRMRLSVAEIDFIAAMALVREAFVRDAEVRGKTVFLRRSGVGSGVSASLSGGVVRALAARVDAGASTADIREGIRMLQRAGADSSRDQR